VKQFVDTYRTAFRGARITVEEQIAEGDTVATRWTGRGTHEGELMGIAPTGKETTVTGLTISRLRNGKVVEEWTNWDTLGMLVQLGAAPQPART
jgi:predicted ester cyclase